MSWRLLFPEKSLIRSQKWFSNWTIIKGLMHVWKVLCLRQTQAMWNEEQGRALKASWTYGLQREPVLYVEIWNVHIIKLSGSLMMEKKLLVALIQVNSCKLNLRRFMVCSRTCNWWHSWRAEQYSITRTQSSRGGELAPFRKGVVLYQWIPLDN